MAPFARFVCALLCVVLVILTAATGTSDTSPAADSTLLRAPPAETAACAASEQPRRAVSDILADAEKHLEAWKAHLSEQLTDAPTPKRLAPVTQEQLRRLLAEAEETDTALAGMQTRLEDMRRTADLLRRKHTRGPR